MISFRKSVNRMLFAGFAVWLAGCSSYQSLPIVVRSFIVPCDALYYRQVTWSPDGKHIAFAEGRHNAAEFAVFVMNPDGREVRQQSDFLSNVMSGLQWSPDSTRLMYVDHVGSDIRIVNLDGSPPAVISPNNPPVSASWGPDSQRIVYTDTSYVGGSYADLFVADIFG